LKVFKVFRGGRAIHVVHPFSLCISIRHYLVLLEHSFIMPNLPKPSRVVKM
jgi:hypothetical protein